MPGGTLLGMGTVIPWSAIHPRVQSQDPFVGLVIIDPERQICVSELVGLDGERLGAPEAVAGDVVAATQRASAAVASAYLAAVRRRDAGSRPADGDPLRQHERPARRLRVIQGGEAE